MTFIGKWEGGQNGKTGIFYRLSNNYLGDVYIIRNQMQQKPRQFSLEHFRLTNFLFFSLSFITFCHKPQDRFSSCAVFNIPVNHHDLNCVMFFSIHYHLLFYL